MSLYSCLCRCMCLILLLPVNVPVDGERRVTMVLVCCLVAMLAMSAGGLLAKCWRSAGEVRATMVVVCCLIAMLTMSAGAVLEKWRSAGEVRAKCWRGAGKVLARYRRGAEVLTKCWRSTGEVLARCRQSAGKVLDASAGVFWLVQWYPFVACCRFLSRLVLLSRFVTSCLVLPRLDFV